MKFCRLKILIFLTSVCINIKRVTANGIDLRFPDGFLFGAATSAFQVSSKGPDIWNTFTHEYPEKIADRQNTDVTADSYHLFEMDIESLKSLGVCEGMSSMNKCLNK